MKTLLGICYGFLSVSVLVSIVCFLTASVTNEQDGVISRYEYRFWVPMGALWFGMAMLGIAWPMWGHHKGWAAGVALLGIFFAAVVFPTFFRAGVETRPDGFKIESGLWGLTLQEVNFAELDRIQVREQFVTRITRFGRETRKKHDLRCAPKNGGPSFEIVFDDELTRAAARQIFTQALEANPNIFANQ